MRTASRFPAVFGIVVCIALMGTPALAGEKGGGSEGGDRGWDADGWAMVTAAPNTASIDAPIDLWDCVNWVATAIEIGVEPCLAAPVEERSWGQIKSIYR